MILINFDYILPFYNLYLKQTTLNQNSFAFFDIYYRFYKTKTSIRAFGFSFRKGYIERMFIIVNV